MPTTKNMNLGNSDNQINVNFNNGDLILNEGCVKKDKRTIDRLIPGNTYHLSIPANTNLQTLLGDQAAYIMISGYSNLVTSMTGSSISTMYTSFGYNINISSSYATIYGINLGNIFYELAGANASIEVDIVYSSMISYSASAADALLDFITDDITSEINRVETTLTETDIYINNLSNGTYQIIPSMKEPISIYYYGGTSTYYVSCGLTNIGGMLYISDAGTGTKYWMYIPLYSNMTIYYGWTSGTSGSSSSFTFNSNYMTSVPSSYKQVPNLSYASYSIPYQYTTSTYGTSSYPLNGTSSSTYTKFLSNREDFFLLGTSSSTSYGAPYTPTTTQYCHMKTIGYYTYNTTYKYFKQTITCMPDNKTYERYVTYNSSSSITWGTWAQVTSGGGISTQSGTSTYYLVGSNSSSTATDSTLYKYYSSTSSTVYMTSGALYATSFHALSDKRLKENIVPYSPNKSILDLPIYEYNYKESKEHSIGCMAQDLQEYCPQIVETNKDGYLNINESKIVYLLLDEVKKQNKRINELEEKNKRIDKLEQEIEELKKLMRGE